MRQRIIILLLINKFGTLIKKKAHTFVYNKNIKRCSDRNDREIKMRDLEESTKCN